MQSLGDVFGELFARRDGTRTTALLRRHPSEDGTVVDGQKALPAAKQPALEAPPHPNPSTSNGLTADPASPDSQRIRNILEPKGETLEVTDNRVKAKNASDFTRRMTYLLFVRARVLWAIISS